MLDRSTTGFTIRAVGANPHAAATAGMSVGRTTVITMLLAGALAGLAGVEAAWVRAHRAFLCRSLGIVGSIGFDAITVALLGRSRPLGTVLAGLLFGALHAGGLAMQSVAQTPLTLTTVLQALIVLFVAAPALVTKIVPFPKPRETRARPVPFGEDWRERLTPSSSLHRRPKPLASKRPKAPPTHLHRCAHRDRRSTPRDRPPIHHRQCTVCSVRRL